MILNNTSNEKGDYPTEETSKLAESGTESAYAN